MKSKKNNFLESFVQFYRNSFSKKEFSENIDSLEMQYEFYKHFQPTGLFYGAPVITSFIDTKADLENLDSSIKRKYTFLSAILMFHENGKSDNPYDVIFKLAEFYSTIYYLEDSPFEFAGNNENKIRNAQKILKKRILKTHTIKKYFSFRSSHNCLLFLDILFFVKWMKSIDNANSKLKGEMHEIYFSVLKIIASAMWANNTIERSEKYIYKAFISSAQFSKDERIQAKKLMKQRIDVDDIDLSFANDWLLKKYILELAIFTIYSDRMIEHPEREYLLKLAAKLNLDEDEFQASFIAVESFILENWEKIRVLKYKSHAGMVYGELKGRMLSIGKKYKTSFVTEIRESKELMQLINKSRKESLTPEEKEKVKEQLIDIVKTIPALSVTLLPGGTLILFALYEILPDEFLPSGFKSKPKNDLPKK